MLGVEMFASDSVPFMWASAVHAWHFGLTRFLKADAISL